MRKTVYTLAVDAYPREITDLTFPLMVRWAEKIGADFVVIDERRSPHLPPAMEKLQVGERARASGADWNVFFDADALIHPDMPDLTEHVGMDTVFHHGVDPASIRWRLDDYFRRDGRNIGSCNWFTGASRWCLDLWAPLDIPLSEALANVFPIVMEREAKITPEHLLDDYALSRNIARFGLKVTTAVDVLARLRASGNFCWHAYTIPWEQKVEQMKIVIKDWRLG